MQKPPTRANSASHDATCEPRRGDLSRRRFLSCSLLAGGLGVSLADLLRLQAASSPQSRAARPRRAVIQVWLGGGPSQFETFDPKPDAPREFRGPYGVVETKFPGVLFSEHMQRTAQVVDRAAIIRTVSHSTNNHHTGSLWCATGYEDQVVAHPSVGSNASFLRGPNHPGLPAYVQLSHEQERNLSFADVMGSGYLGVAHSPFTVFQSPYENEFQAQKVVDATTNLELATDITLERMTHRRQLLRGLDRMSRLADTARTLAGQDEFHSAALDMIVSGEARSAFDLTQEPKSVRRRYGEHRWGQMALLARRLVEAGTTFVTINTAPDCLCWDWHLNIVNDKRPADGSQGPSRGMDLHGTPLDQMVSALVTDIYERGLDEEVLLVVWGEFGRTPRINKTGGRDHWGALMSILMAGGGLRVGQVIGSSTSKGEEPHDRPVHPNDVVWMMYRHLGIDPTAHTTDTQGRPFRVLPSGGVISELV